MIRYKEQMYKRGLREGTRTRLANGNQESSGIQIRFISPGYADNKEPHVFRLPRQIPESLQGMGAET